MNYPISIHFYLSMLGVDIPICPFLPSKLTIHAPQVLGKNWDQHSSSLPTSCFLWVFILAVAKMPGRLEDHHLVHWFPGITEAIWSLLNSLAFFKAGWKNKGDSWLLPSSPPVDAQLGPKRSPIETISGNAQQLHPIWGSTIFGQTQF